MDQIELIAFVTEVMENLEIPYMLTGSHASAYYGEPRFTRDIDIVADLRPEQIDEFAKCFPGDTFYCDRKMIRVEVANHGQFNIIHTESGIKIDIILPKDTAFSRSELSRKLTGSVLPGRKANFASPEDVIVKKMEFYREGGSEKHLRDIAGILKITGEIDNVYVAEWADRLGLRDIWDAVLERVAQGRKN